MPRQSSIHLPLHVVNESVPSLHWHKYPCRRFVTTSQIPWPHGLDEQESNLSSHISSAPTALPTYLPTSRAKSYSIRSDIGSSKAAWDSSFACTRPYHNRPYSRRLRQRRDSDKKNQQLMNYLRCRQAFAALTRQRARSFYFDCSIEYSFS